MHAPCLAELTFCNGVVGNVGQVGQDGAHQHAQHLAQNSDGNGQCQCGLGRRIGQDGKGCADDGRHVHIRGCSCADVHDAKAHQLDGCAKGQAGLQITQQRTDNGAGDERTLEVHAAQNARVQNTEHANQTQK